MSFLGCSQQEFAQQLIQPIISFPGWIQILIQRIQWAMPTRAAASQPAKKQNNPVGNSHHSATRVGSCRSRRCLAAFCPMDMDPFQVQDSC